MNERINKTSILSVVFLDIVGYSQKPVSEQIEYKDRFNALIGEAIKGIAQSDLIVLDTGDGAAISLMGGPEDALFVALTIRDGILADNQNHPLHQMLVRIGINLGPVRIVKDINGRPNVIGDGINVAQRVMSFAEPNQILVSRSYYEIVSRLSGEMLDMFIYSGIKQDKHVREHEVYQVTSAHGAAEDAPLPPVTGVPAEDMPSPPPPAGKARAWKPAAMAGLALCAMVAVGAVVKFGGAAEPAVSSAPPQAAAPATPQPQPAAQVAAPDKPAKPAANVEKPKKTAEVGEKKKPKAKVRTARVSDKPAAAANSGSASAHNSPRGGADHKNGNTAANQEKPAAAVAEPEQAAGIGCSDAMRSLKQC